MTPKPSVPYAGFAVFGTFWGVWGATLALLREQAGVDDAQLGIALLGIGLGSPPAMAAAGWVVDRFGARVSGVFLMLMAITALIGSITATNFAALFICTLVLGATSGAADVSLNSLAGLIEAHTGTRVIARSHASFSIGVVVGSLGTGGALALSAPLWLIYLVMAAAVIGAGVLALLRAGGAHPVSVDDTPLSGWRSLLPFLLIGVIGALALAVESAFESWTSIFLIDELGAVAALAALAPATSAIGLAVGRLVMAALPSVRPAVILGIGGAVAAIGTLVFAGASSVPMALAGIFIGALGLSGIFPTLLSEAVRDQPLSARGRATSATTTVAFLGFLFAPVFVGVVSDASGLRVSMVGIAIIAVVCAVTATAWVTLRTRAAR